MKSTSQNTLRAIDNLVWFKKHNEAVPSLTNSVRQEEAYLYAIRAYLFQSVGYTAQAYADYRKSISIYQKSIDTLTQEVSKDYEILKAYAAEAAKEDAQIPRDPDVLSRISESRLDITLKEHARNDYLYGMMQCMSELLKTYLDNHDYSGSTDIVVKFFEDFLKMKKYELGRMHEPTNQFEELTSSGLVGLVNQNIRTHHLFIGMAKKTVDLVKYVDRNDFPAANLIDTLEELARVENLHRLESFEHLPRNPHFRDATNYTLMTLNWTERKSQLAGLIASAAYLR